MEGRFCFVQKAANGVKPAKRKKNWKLIMSTNVPLFIMCIPCIVLLICFAYMPMFGTVLAFKTFKPRLGIWGSPWAGMKNFNVMFKNPTFWAVLRNTVSYNLVVLVIGRIFPPALAIAINEVRSKKLARVFQTTMIMPNFVSYVVVSVIVLAILGADNGILGRMYKNAGLTPIAFYSEPKYWPYILTIVNTWKGTGYGSIIYLGTITGISDEYYEAAVIDGATKWQQILHITLPFLKSMIIILTIMAVGSMFHASFDLFYQVPQNSGQLYKVTNTIDVFVFNTLKDSNNVGLSSAVALFQSITGFVLVMLTNQIVRWIDKDLSMF